MSQVKVNRVRLSLATGVIIELLSVGLIYILSQLTVGLIVASFGDGSSEALTNNTSLVLVAYILGGMATVGFCLGLMKRRSIVFSLLELI